MSDRCCGATISSHSHPTLGYRPGNVERKRCAAAAQKEDAAVGCGCSWSGSAPHTAGHDDSSSPRRRKKFSHRRRKRRPHRVGIPSSGTGRGPGSRGGQTGAPRSGFYLSDHSHVDAQAHADDRLTRRRAVYRSSMSRDPDNDCRCSAPQPSPRDGHDHRPGAVDERVTSSVVAVVPERVAAAKLAAGRVSYIEYGHITSVWSRLEEFVTWSNWMAWPISCAATDWMSYALEAPVVDHLNSVLNRMSASTGLPRHTRSPCTRAPRCSPWSSFRLPQSTVL